jgi:hypothetical protein
MDKAANDDGAYAEYIAHEEFRAGLPAGRFRVVVDLFCCSWW